MAQKVQGISGAAVAAVFVGGILAWSGLRGYKVSYLTQDLLSGKNPQQDSRIAKSQLGVTPGGLFGGVLGSINPFSLLSQTGTVTATGGGVSGTAAQNKALGQRMAAAVGWTGAQWTAFNNIVMAESSWNANAANPTSNARGIAQNINGWGPNYQPGNAPQQIAWMIHYIQSRYGTPVNAWQFHLANGSY
jgi:hypothetical protein